MNTSATAVTVSACMVGAVWLRMQIRRWLPEHHLSADTKDTVKLAMGLAATMTALVLGLLVSSAESSYDTTRGEVIQMAAKVAFIDRVLVVYGLEAGEARSQFRALMMEGAVRQMPGEGKTAQLAPDVAAGDALYAAIQALSPKDDIQRRLKVQVTSLLVELGQLRTLLFAQSVPSISKALLAVVVAWLVVIFFSFSLVNDRITTKHNPYEIKEH